MRRFLLLLAAALFLWGTAAAQDTPVEPWQAFTARVAEITASDTLGVRRSTDGEVTSVAPTCRSPHSPVTRPPRGLCAATGIGRATGGWQ